MHSFLGHIRQTERQKWKAYPKSVHTKNPTPQDQAVGVHVSWFLYSQSAFLSDCFFLEGFEMTLMRLLRKTPMLALLPYSMRTDSMKCLRLSESEMYNVLAVQ